MLDDPSSTWLVRVFTFVIGACIGSFLNVCVARWPVGESVVRPPSRCPRCGKGIAARDNLPILGWVLLRGKCRGCGLPISSQYPLVELVVALGWLGAVVGYGPTFTAFRIAFFGTVMFGIALTDAQHYLIPDEFTVIPFLWILASSVITALGVDASPFAGPWEALMGACVGAGAISIAGWLGEHFMKKEAMGFGDVTLMALVGAAVGPGRALLVIFVGALIGAAVFLLIVYPIVRIRGARPSKSVSSEPSAARPAPKSKTPKDAAAQTDQADETNGTNDDVEMPYVPFGVFLAPAALVTLLWGQRLIEWYMGRMQII